MVKDALWVIDDKLGSFVGMVETDMNCSSPIIIDKVDVNVFYFKHLDININDKIISQKPIIIEGLFRIEP